MISTFPFDYEARTRVIYGPGKLNDLSELVKTYGGSRVLLVTDAGLVKAGHVQRVVDLLCDAGIEVGVFSDTQENPSTLDVAKVVESAQHLKADFLIGFGGGSSMDAAKGGNFILTNGGKMEDYWGSGKATKPMLPFIAIPTTAGTGSETQSYALISQAETHAKMACGDKKAAAKVAILDPELTLSLPKNVTVLTGIDALTHALEASVTRKRNSVSLLYAKEAFRLLSGAFERVIQSPSDLEARGAMLLGSSFAGVAIEASMLGAAHSCANPLTANYGITHGQAVGLMMPHVIRFNSANEEAQQTYQSLGVDDLPVQFQHWLEIAGLKSKLSELGVDRSLIPTLAEQAAKQWTAQFNPIIPSVEQFEELYQAAW